MPCAQSLAHVKVGVQTLGELIYVPRVFRPCNTRRHKNLRIHKVLQALQRVTKWKKGLEGTRVWEKGFEGVSSIDAWPRGLPVHAERQGRVIRSKASL